MPNRDPQTASGKFPETGGYQLAGGKSRQSGRASCHVNEVNAKTAKSGSSAGEFPGVGAAHAETTGCSVSAKTKTANVAPIVPCIRSTALWDDLEAHNPSGLTATQKVGVP